MVVLHTRKNDEDLIKNRGARVFTTLYINFSDVQGQITRVGDGIWRKFEFIQAFMHVLLTCKNEVDQIKNEGARDFSRYKSMGIFPDAQGQLTPQSLVRSGRISNSSEMLWMSSLPASMKKIRLKIEVFTTLYINFSDEQEFFRRARADNSGVGGGIWPKFELIQAFMHVLLTCKNEDDGFKTEGAREFTRFLPL